MAGLAAMAIEVRSYSISVPAGTLASAPLVSDLPMPPRIVRQIDVRIPPGPMGAVGFAIGAAGQPVLPREPGTWIVANDERITWPLTGQIDSGAWQVFAYNTGMFDHVIYVRFDLDLIASSSASRTYLPLVITP